MNINIAIVEDEPEAADDLRKNLQTYADESGEQFNVTSFSSAIELLNPYRAVYDLIFMDIRMPGTDGMTASERLREFDPDVPLVFVTSMVQFAVRGYSVDALDFIVKPVRYPAFRMKLKRILSAVATHRGESVLIHIDGGTRVVPARDVYFVEVTGHNLTYHTSEGCFTVRGKLRDAAEQLPKDAFYRCSASHLVNLRYVTNIRSEDADVASETIRISRGKKKDFMAALSAYLGKGV